MAFKQGKSGNPSGRPKQIATATDLRNRLVEEMPEIIQKLIDMAKSGDAQAIKMILDRTHPPLKAQALPVKIPTDGTLVDQGNAVIQATLSGQIPPDIGTALVTALCNQGKLVDLEEVSNRLASIERLLEARK
ncbi:DUF5681 domain-containing protein [Methyloglobulus sp.]|uniref:DUF5681 domain-containing protein n=1 Tax=Methyloglobulus sp. TaxID=2518622 RepID=UPI0032B87263